MRSLNIIKDKKILLVVAHPDDETLWFYQSMNELKQHNIVEILCLTYSAVTLRGRELLALGKSLDVKIHFGHCKDLGMNRLLDAVEYGVLKSLSRSNFDLLITHPPHGGERPHPHHIQSYVAVKKICRRLEKQFGFFSEQTFMLRSSDDQFGFDLKQRQYIQKRVSQSRNMLHQEPIHKKWANWLTANLEIWFDFDLYDVFQVDVQTDQKQNALGLFESQIDILKSYNTYSKTSEYLFLGPHPQK